MSSVAGGGVEVISCGGVLYAGGNGLFGSVITAEGRSAITGKSQVLFVDRTATANIVASLANATMGLYATLDNAGNTEYGEYANSIVPNTVTGTALTKASVNGTINTAAVSAFGGNRILAMGVLGGSGTAGTNTQGDLIGVYGTAQVNTGTDATASAVLANIVNIGGTAVTTVATALSKYGLLIGSSGNSANTAFIYCTKTSGVPGTTPQNCAHGILVDSASVATGGVALGCVTGTAPATTPLWALLISGKHVSANADIVIATQAITAALTSARGLLTITALALAAVTSINVACTTAAALGVTTASRVKIDIQNQTGAAAGFIIAAADAVAANAFNIRLTNLTAATIYGGGAFSVYYEIMN